MEHVINTSSADGYQRSNSETPSPSGLVLEEKDLNSTPLARRDLYLVTTCSGQAERNLERIVDEPLERSERADHEDTRGQAVPQAAEADIAVDPRDGLACALAGFAVAVELGYHDV